ncbi:MAG: DUF3024 domain-containing protein [Solirubrobacteraceae bacterium]
MISAAKRQFNERRPVGRESELVAGVLIRDYDLRVLPGLDVAAIRHYCEQRVPPHALHQVCAELVLTRGAATIAERRAPWREEYGPEWTSRGVARPRYTTKSGVWTLYWSDRNGRWHRYDLLQPTADIRVILDEVDRDPTCIFWG